MNRGRELLPRGAYVLPVGDRRTGRPLIVLVSRYGRLVDLFVVEPGESETAALERAEAMLEMLDPQQS